MEEEFELLKGAFSNTEIEDEYLTCILHYGIGCLTCIIQHIFML